MDFALAQRFLAQLTSEMLSRRHPGRLDRMRAFLELLGNPERRFRSVLVGGTAGKGSTATMCAAILRAAGYNVGLHTKPHLRTVTERAQLNGSLVSDERFAQLLESMLPAIDEMERSEWGRPSYFEVIVGLAFRLFAEERVDVAVVEVGIGGALDATNLLAPSVCVITNIGMDHADVLGPTIEQIAADKAGIIKEQTPVVTASENERALDVIRSAARGRNAPLAVVRECSAIEALPSDMAYAQAFRVTTEGTDYEILMPVLGQFQLVNAATAILACRRMTADLPFSAEAVTGGLAAISLPGRMEFHPSRPSVLFDVAHNEEKARALGGALQYHFPDRRYVFVIAIAEGKDAAAMIDQWSDLPAHFICTTFDVSHRRPMNERTLALIVGERGASARAVEDPLEALSLARRIAGASDLVVVTGSTFLVSELREWFWENVETVGHASV